ncbi:MAG: undecaprenyl-diphosphate phosphatase [Bacteroidales bacterium]|jgi:undecaprenyl-diphosphatase|nr:undecaprenyl-diphosphate phosphatase [Bacteroidales bacterium]
MGIVEAIILGLVQGLTEFLPVSSSGHLIIANNILQINTSAADNLQFIVIVHSATVMSTIVILWKEIAGLFRGTFSTTRWNEEKSYVLKIFISMIPVMIIGLFFKEKVEALFGESLLLVGSCLLLTALLLTFSYYAKPRQKEKISYRDSFIIGLSQAVAVLPGLSRSGSTIASGLLLGNKKEQVAQFSFLMVLIPILGEAFLDVVKMITSTQTAASIEYVPLIAGFASAFAAGCFACKFMINLVKKGKLIYFAIYCLAVGLVSIVYSLW